MHRSREGSGAFAVRFPGGVVMEKQDKVLVTLTADADLEKMFQEVNDGFKGGRVTKTQLLSWMVHFFMTEYFADCKEAIRSAHFDALAQLESVVKELKEARRTGNPNVNVSDLLQPILNQNQIGSNLRSKRKAGNSKISLDID